MADQVVTYDPVPNELRYPDIGRNQGTQSSMPHFRLPKIDDLDDLLVGVFAIPRKRCWRSRQRKIAGVKRVPAKKAAKCSPVRRAVVHRRRQAKAAAKKTREEGTGKKGLSEADGKESCCETICAKESRQALQPVRRFCKLQFLPQHGRYAAISASRERVSQPMINPLLLLDVGDCWHPVLKNDIAVRTLE